MKTVDEYNEEFVNRRLEPSGTGIACPDCKTEVVYESNTILTSYPPKRWVICPNCSYRGTVYA